MTEEQTPYTPMAAPPALPPRAQDDPTGTLGRGIGQFFAWVVGGTAVAVLTMSGLFSIDLPQPLVDVLLTLMLALPWFIAIYIGICHAVRGRTRTALGMLVGFGILVALVVLLVAACFGILGGLRIAG